MMASAPAPASASASTSGELRQVSVGGVDLACRFEGPAGAPVVLLAHGLLADHTMWDELAGRLLANGFSVLRYDLRGHGRSGLSAGPWTMEQLAADAVGLLDAFGLSRVHFVGSSLGGMIGQQMGARHADRLLSLTLANTAAVQLAAQAWNDRIALARSHGVAALADGTLQRWFTPGFAQANPSQIQCMRDVMCRTPVEGFAGCAQAVRDLAQLQLLPAIRLPVLVIAGAQDQATPPDQSVQLREGIAGAFLVTLPAAHQSAVEQPQAFFDAWCSFAAQLPAAGEGT